MEEFEYYTQYEGLEELREFDPAMAEELEEARPEVKSSEEIDIYDDLETFADHEIVEGWYYDSFNVDLSDFKIYHGAPRIYDFIDLKGLGKAMANTWDKGCHYLSSSGTVVEFL